MAAFKVDKEITYDKSLSETLSDIKKAFTLIGKIKKFDSEAYKIEGRTKCGLQTVKIVAQAEYIGDKTKVLFHGKSDDFGAVGAQKGIDNLINTMQNLDNKEYVPSKTAGIKPLVVIAGILEFTISLILIFGFRTGKFQTSFLIVLIIIWIILAIYLVLVRLKASKTSH